MSLAVVPMFKRVFIGGIGCRACVQKSSFVSTVVIREASQSPSLRSSLHEGIELWAKRDMRIGLHFGVAAPAR